MSNEDLSHELAIKYTFENFDFKNNSPKDLLMLYQDTKKEILDILDKQQQNLVEESINSFNGVYAF